MLYIIRDIWERVTWDDLAYFARQIGTALCAVALAVVGSVDAIVF